MRSSIHRVIIDFSKYNSYNVKAGLYPPKVNICKNQSNEELAKELIKIYNYLKMPEYSYLNKNKNK